MPKEKRKRGRPKGTKKNNERELPNLPKTDKIIAIVCADIHLSNKPPIWRSSEPDWYGAMRRSLLQLCKLQEELECPVLIAGDIFDRWNAPPELISFAMKYLPSDSYTIPGQHDLPLHNYDDMGKSAYGVLKTANIIADLPIGVDLWLNQYLSIKGFPWGTPLQKCDTAFGGIKVAVVHDYKWIEGCGYPTAPEEKKFGKRISGVDEKGRWLGWDVVIYGDNHKGFLHRVENTIIFNCGSLMRRHSDQKDYRPMVGLLTKEGHILPHYLDISGEKHLESLEEEKIKESLDLSDFFTELQKLGDSSLDFLQTIRRYMDDEGIKKGVRKIIENILSE